MCFPGLDPVTLAIMAASTAASVGGGMINSNQQQQNALRAQQANNNVLSKYLKKQKEYETENRNTLNNTLDTYAPEQQQQSLDQAATNRIDAAEANTAGAQDSGAAASTAAVSSAPKVVQDAFAQALGSAKTASSNETAARSRMSSYGDVWQGNRLQNEAAGRDIGYRNSFANQDTALLPYEQQWAQMISQKPNNGLGSILQGIGALGSLYAGFGAPGLATAANAAGTVGNTLGASYYKAPLKGLY